MTRKVAFACAIKYNGQVQFGGFGQDLFACRVNGRVSDDRGWLQGATSILTFTFLSPSELKPVGE